MYARKAQVERRDGSTGQQRCAGAARQLRAASPNDSILLFVRYAHRKWWSILACSQWMHDVILSVQESDHPSPRRLAHAWRMSLPLARALVDNPSPLIPSASSNARSATRSMCRFELLSLIIVFFERLAARKKRFRAPSDLSAPRPCSTKSSSRSPDTHRRCSMPRTT